MFGLGFNSSKSQSTSEGYGYSRSGSASESLSSGRSQSTAGSQARSFTDVAFEDIFASLYGNAGEAASRVASMAPQFNQQAASLFSGGLDFLGALGANDDYIAARMGGDDGLLEEQIGALGDDLGQFFREELNPAITSRAVAGGSLGGGRQGVAQGRAASAVAQEFQRGATSLRVADQQQRDALLRERAAGASAGLGALPSLLSVAQTGFGAELAPWEALSGILGGPVTLAGSESSSFSQSTAEDVARAIAESFGLSEDFQRSQSSSRSRGFNIGFGGGD